MEADNKDKQAEKSSAEGPFKVVDGKRIFRFKAPERVSKRREKWKIFGVNHSDISKPASTETKIHDYRAKGEGDEVLNEPSLIFQSKKIAESVVKKIKTGIEDIEGTRVDKRYEVKTENIESSNYRRNRGPTVRFTSLSTELDRYELKDLLSQYGTVIYVARPRDRRTGEILPFAFATFSRKEECLNCIRGMSGVVYDGIMTKVVMVDDENNH